MNVGGRRIQRNLSYTNYTSCMHVRLRCPSVLVVFGLTLILIGCGQLSIGLLLEKEDPGEFRSIPAVANVPEGSTVIVQGQGGFKPYTYAKISALGDLDLDTGAYIASGGAEIAEIAVIDTFGRSVTCQIEVFASLRLKANREFVSHITAYDNQTIAFDADGGVVVGGYNYYVDNILVERSALDGLWTFGPSPKGIYTVEVFDDLGNLAEVTVAIVASIGGDLAIDPRVTYVPQGGTVSFTGFNVEGKATYTATAGMFNGTSPNDIYTAPLAPFTGEVTVTLTDNPSGNFVTAALKVLDYNPPGLVLSPSLVKLVPGDEIKFTVSGGVPPYAYWLEYEGQHGKLEQISATNAHYMAPYLDTVDWVWVKDDIGSPPRRAEVHVMQ